jgi:heme oxygenase
MISRQMANLRDRLKEATAGDHAALEQTGVLRAFSSTCTSPAVYADYLARQWHLHRVMEPVLQGWLGAGWADARLVKSEWLEQDLATLHSVPEARQIAWDRPRSAAQALGTAYVLEGATLGIRQSVRSLPATHPAHGPANRFVQGYGEHTGAHWKDFVAHLEDVDPVLWPDVLAGASAAFRAFATHFSQRMHLEPNESASV